MSGDGRAGATAPTTPFRPNEVAVRAAEIAERDWGTTADCLAAAFPVMLAAWIDGLTDEQLEGLFTDALLRTDDGDEAVYAAMRAALTRLGGAHE
jgi:hypothetical protein